MKKDFSGQLRTRNAKRLCTDLAAAVLFALKLSVNIVPSSVHAIYQTAGKEQLLAERQKIGSIAPGQAVITPAFDLPAKYIVHTVGPIWTDGKQGEFDLLRSCYGFDFSLSKSE